MQQLTVSTTRPEMLATEADLVEFEEKFNVTLPNYLKEFIMQYGGQGILERYFIFEDGDWGRLDGTLPLLNRHSGSSIEFLSSALKEVWGEVRYIGFVTCASLVLYVKIGGDDDGDIYYWTEDHDVDDYLLRLDNFTFESLINSLSAVHPDEQDPV